MPVTLGCCPSSPRCLLCLPAPADTSPTKVAALIEATRDKHGPERPLEVRFFGGPPPTDAQLAAVGDLPVGVRVRPDLLSRADAARLRSAGVRSVELDALSFDRSVLKAVGRSHPPSLVDEISQGLRAMGLSVGGVLAPGLPGQSHATAIADARHVVGRWDFARLHPVLVLDHAGLREAHETGRYTPLTLGEAITVCRDMLDILEPGGVEVVRVGLQPGPDGFGRAVAGPHDPGFRELVEARRVHDRIDAALDDVPQGAVVTVRCAPADETRTRGMYNRTVRALRADHGLDAVHVVADPALPRGRFAVDVHEEPR